METNRRRYYDGDFESSHLWRNRHVLTLSSQYGNTPDAVDAATMNDADMEFVFRNIGYETKNDRRYKGTVIWCPNMIVEPRDWNNAGGDPLDGQIQFFRVAGCGNPQDWSTLPTQANRVTQTGNPFEGPFEAQNNPGILGILNTAQGTAAAEPADTATSTVGWTGQSYLNHGIWVNNPGNSLRFQFVDTAGEVLDWTTGAERGVWAATCIIQHIDEPLE